MKNINTMFHSTPEQEAQHYSEKTTQVVNDVNNKLERLFLEPENVSAKLADTNEINKVELELAGLFGNKDKMLELNKKTPVLSLASAMQDLENYSLAA